MARYFLAGRGITMPEPGRTDVPYWITTEAEARKAVQEQAALKVDLIKIWVDDRDGKYKKLPAELYTPVIDEAHKHQLRVAAHIFNLSDAKGLLKAGIDAFAHGIRDVDADDEVVTLIKARKNVVLIPNMPDRGVKADYSWLKGSIPDGELAKIQAGATDRPPAQAAWGIQARNLKKLSDAGMTIAVGTDGNTAWAPHVEMADMVASGMTPAQVIVSATKNGAEFLRMSDTGTIAVGKNADLLVLDANPLDDITNTRRISAVYLKGVAVDRAAAMKAAAARIADEVKGPLGGFDSEPQADAMGVLAAHTSPRRPLTPSADLSGIQATPAFRLSSVSLGLTVRVASQTTQRRGLRFRRDDPHRISPRRCLRASWSYSTSTASGMEIAVGLSRGVAILMPPATGTA